MRVTEPQRPLDSGIFDLGMKPPYHIPDDHFQNSLHNTQTHSRVF